MNDESKEEKGAVENEEVILVQLYEVLSKTTSSSTTSFITDKVENLAKYMKFVKTPSQTRIFRLPPYYQALKSRGEQDLEFWKEVAMAFVDKKGTLIHQETGIKYQCIKEVHHMNHTS